MSDQVDIKISQDLIKPIIQTKIQAAIVDAMQGSDHMIAQVVKLICDQKVDSRGGISRYGSDNKYRYIDILCKNAISDAARAAITEWVERDKKLIQAEMLKQMQTKRYASKMAKSVADGLAEAVKSSWRFKVDVSLPGD
jgi:hypothetical protein